MKWYHYLLIAFIVLVLVLVGLFIKNEFDKKDIEIGKQATALNQQQKHYTQSLKDQKFEMEQERFAAIASLNDDVDSEKAEGEYWKAQTNKLQLEVAELKASGTGVSTTDNDSSGQYFKVDFAGVQDMFTYEGYTKKYVDDVIPPYYWLNVKLKPIGVVSTLLRDSEGLWKINTVSKTKGVKLKAESVIDSTFYNFIANEDFNKVNTGSSNGDYMPIGLRFKLNLLLQSADYLESLEQTQFDASVEFYVYYFNATYHALHNKLSIGVFYDWNIHKSFSFIF